MKRVSWLVMVAAGLAVPGLAMAAVDCGSLPDARAPAQRVTVLAPLALELTAPSYMLGANSGVLGHAYDESQTVDEVLLRGSVSPEMGAILVFQWNSAAGEFVPVQFTDDRDQTNPFAVVDATEPVILHPSGDIEVQFETTRQDGRKTTHVARYRWNGQHYTHTADN